MNAVSWNCRGLGNSAANPYVCELVRGQKADVIFLCETIANTSKIDEIRARLRYDCSFSVDCIGRGGGLCVMWKSATFCDIVNYSQNHIDLLIHDVDGPWRFTGFYEHPERNKRRLSWNFLRHLAGTNTIPWICMGDFNDLLSVEDKKGGAPHSNWLFQGFREAVSDSNLHDMPLIGHQYTWSRGGGANNLLEERLDRALGNPSWHVRFPNAKLHNLVAPISDHSPIFLETKLVIRTRRKYVFHFENKWLDEPYLKSVVGRSWSGSSNFPLLKRLQATSEVLGDWGKHIAMANIRI